MFRTLKKEKRAVQRRLVEVSRQELRQLEQRTADIQGTGALCSTKHMQPDYRGQRCQIRKGSTIYETGFYLS
jgi:hypothetical protein